MTGPSRVRPGTESVGERSTSLPIVMNRGEPSNQELTVRTLTGAAVAVGRKAFVDVLGAGLGWRVQRAGVASATVDQPGWHSKMARKGGAATVRTRRTVVHEVGGA